MNETQVIPVRYWAAARAAAGTATEEVALSAPVTLADLREELVRRHAAAPATGSSARLADVLAVCSVLLGDRPVRSQDPATVVVPEGVTVEFLPPFAGG